MSRTDALPDDMKAECLCIVRGYDRRVKEYREKYEQVIHGSRGNDGMPGGSECGSSVERKVAQLEAIEHHPETQKMRAVEQALYVIGADVENPEERDALVRAMMLNCASGRKYPFRYLSVGCMSERTFNRRKRQFLFEIAIFLEMI